MAALDQQVALCMADVPSACWLEKRVFDRVGGGANIAKFLDTHPALLDTVFDTLSYYDNINHACDIKCPTLVSVGLKDPICPADCAYAAFNKITAPKEMCAYPFGEHGGGGSTHETKKLQFFAEHLTGYNS